MNYVNKIGLSLERNSARSLLSGPLKPPQFFHSLKLTIWAFVFQHQLFYLDHNSHKFLHAWELLADGKRSPGRHKGVSIFNNLFRSTPSGPISRSRGGSPKPPFAPFPESVALSTHFNIWGGPPETLLDKSFGHLWNILKHVIYNSI